MVKHGLSTARRAGLLLIAILVLSACQKAAHEDSQSEALSESPATDRQAKIAECDKLASHPDDPARFGSGVSDQALAPGAVIEICQAAVVSDYNAPAAANAPARGANVDPADCAARRGSFVCLAWQKSHPAGKAPEELVEYASCDNAGNTTGAVPARTFFQLGRGYLAASRHAEAVDAFQRAARCGHAASLKFLGDAYVSGQGIPALAANNLEPGASEQQNLQTALSFYKKSNAQGFLPAGAAVRELETYINQNTFDPSVFQQGTAMQMLYAGNFSENVKTPAQAAMLASYVEGFNEMMDSEQMMDMDPECKTMMHQVGMVSARVASGLSKFAMWADSNSGEELIGNILVSALGGSVMRDAGSRDAVSMVNRYKCNSPITKQVFRNIMTIQ